MLPVEQVRPLITRWTDRGWPISAVAAAAGIDKHTVVRIVDGTQATVRRDTAQALAAVADETGLIRSAKPHAALPVALFVGFRRRVQALQAAGWPLADIASEAGISSYPVITKAMRQGHVTRHLWEQMAAAYERLSMTPGPSSLARGRAVSRGFAPPMAWDDIDDPNGLPRGVPSTDSDPPRTAWLDRLRELWERDPDVERVSDELGLMVATVAQRLRRWAPEDPLTPTWVRVDKRLRHEARMADPEYRERHNARRRQSETRKSA